MRTLFLVATLPLLVGMAMADEHNFAVGTCKAHATSFTMIQTAVNAVPPGSTIFVCPGVYAEQVIISKPLTLQGIGSNNADQAVIVVPSGGLSANVTSISGEPVAAQVLVQNTSDVNLSNIVVDGTGGTQSCSTTSIWLAGIFYASNSSGNVSHVRASGQSDDGCGVGIWAENAGAGPYQSVSINASSVHDVDGVGISLLTQSPPTLTVDVENNYISSAPGIGVFAVGVSGNVSNNNLNNSMVGVFDFGAAATISSNDVNSTTFGIAMLSTGSAQGNDIANTSNGVFVEGDGANIQQNRIILASVAGVEFNCHVVTVSNNRINDAAVGLNDVPAGFTGTNTFFNTGTVITNTCVAPLAPASAVRGAAPMAAGVSSIRPGMLSQWRTPANPKGIPH
jgi:hypothetical protein